MIDEEHGGFGDLGRPPVDLDAVELTDGEFGFQRGVQGHAGLSLTATDLFDDLGFDPSQVAVGDHEEVPAPAGRVDEHVGGEPVPELA